MRVVTVRASVVVAMATPELKPARENIKFSEKFGSALIWELVPVLSCLKKVEID